MNPDAPLERIAQAEKSRADDDVRSPGLSHGQSTQYRTRAGATPAPTAPLPKAAAAVEMA